MSRGKEEGVETGDRELSRCKWCGGDEERK
jgi:hypothetical protein